MFQAGRKEYSMYKKKYLCFPTNSCTLQYRADGTGGTASRVLDQSEAVDVFGGRKCGEFQSDVVLHTIRNTE